jgi:diguanylate cyclase (GGDEF)-like protein
MMRVAFGIFVAESIAVWVYAIVTPDGTHRFALAVIGAASAVTASLSLRVIPWIARQPWREQFSLSWTLLAGVALTGAAWLDDGLRSPLLLLILLPVTYAGLMFRPAAVAGCGALSLVELATLAVTEPLKTDSGGRLLVLASVTAGLGLLTWLSSVHRTRADCRTATLTHDLEVLASTDGLTGCLNHLAFTERLDEEIDRAVRYGHPLSLVIADVDRFKQVNDTYGHPAGDAALVHTADAMRSGCRSSDILGRLGGDEFAMLLPGTSPVAAAALAQRVFDSDGSGTSRPTFSVGVAGLDPTKPTAGDLFREADKAMYHAKRSGGRGVAVRTPFGAVTRVERQLQST